MVIIKHGIKTEKSLFFDNGCKSCVVLKPVHEHSFSQHDQEIIPQVHSTLLLYV